MRKRLIEKLTSAKKGSLGYTLTELLVVIGIIAILCGIAIPSMFWLSSTLRFKQRNDYAKSIFMAAQQNLSVMRANGQLGALQSAGGSGFIPASMAATAGDDLSEYVYTASSRASGSDSAAMELMLPTGSVDGSALAEQIIIEYNPVTGNIYSVFYSEETENILNAYIGGTLPRDRDARKDIMLGYYDGTSLSSSQITLDKTQASVELINGEEAVIRVRVPMPDEYYGNHNTFLQAMQIDLTIAGEQSQTLTFSNGAGGQTSLAGSFSLSMKNAGEQKGSLDVTGKEIVVDYPIDSLMDNLSFANFASGTQAGATDHAGSSLTKPLTALMNETDFAVLPGDNITIQADISFPGSEVLVQVDSGICSGVNPMFDSLIPMGNGKYTLYVSNGRNLQNLNALSPSIADMVGSVMFKEDIDWAATVSYYNNKAADGSYANAPDENPARALPYFVPIHSENLFGTARFIFPDSDGSADGGLGSWLTQWLRGYSNESVPTLTDEIDSINGAEHASIQGSGHKVYNININAPAYKVPNNGTFYATGPNQVVDYYFTGLFGYVNTPISDLELVNPIVRGHNFDDTTTMVPDYSSAGDLAEWWTGNRPMISITEYNNPATGSLLGVGGFNTLITNCGTYVDQYAPGYNAAMHNRSTYDDNTLYSTSQKHYYGVSGQGAVGGLVGYCKSHLSVSGELTGDTEHLAFSECFAAIPVSGNMRGSSRKDFGYSNGVGGLLGNSQLTNFYKCYASGNVRADGCYVAELDGNTFVNFLENIAQAGAKIFFDSYLELDYSGRTGMGVGGFVGSSHGTRYTNCFATGNVTAASSSSSKKKGMGGGGFVGFMSADETFLYGHGSDTEAEVKQRSVFTNCYSVGVARNDNSNLENFAGAAGRISRNLGQSAASFYCNYYHLYAPHYAGQNKKDPDFEDWYLFRNCYFLANYTGNQSNAQNVSTVCAESATYPVMTDLPGAHAYKSTWNQSRLKNVRELSTLDLWLIFPVKSTYEEKYFSQYRELGDKYHEKYTAGFNDGMWEPASSATTHPFSTSAMGAVYPFSKLKGMDYYGDWPTKPSSMGIAYYETYADTGETHYLFDSEHEEQGNLVLRDYKDLSKDSDEVVVKKDGYVILSASNTPLTVTIGTQSAVLQREPTTLTVNNKPYYVFVLTDELMAEKPADGEFFLEVFAQHGTGTTYTMYFNPGVAISHANPVDTGNASTSTTAAKPKVPRTINVRSARQFAALSTLDDYISDSFRYVQQLNIDADLYGWSGNEAAVKKAKLLSAIGSQDDPFSASYRSYSDETQAELRNFGLKENAAGIFDTIGSTGLVENILVETDQDISTETDTNASVVAGVNNGTMTNVDVRLTGNVSLTAKDSAGLLTAISSGNVKNCKVTAKGTVSLSAPTTGGYIGTVHGSADKMAALQNAALSVEDPMTLGQAADADNPAERTAGGFLGKASLANTENLTVALNTISASADYAGGIFGSTDTLSLTNAELELSSLTGANGYMAGVIGKGTDTSMISVDAFIGSVSGDHAAGFLGLGENTDVSNSALTVTGSIRGNASAAGVASSLGAKSLFSYLPVDLSSAKVTAADKAAGYAVEVLEEAIIQNSPVSIGAIGSSTTEVAAGYACTISGSVQSSGIRGTGSVTGGKAAGFAASLDDKGRAASCVVTPAVEDTADAYLDNGSENLTISGTTEASGFALSVSKDASVSSSYVLGTVTAGQDGKAAGFVLNNKGTIELCTANITINGGHAFAAVNNGLIARCYGWYTTTKDASVSAELSAESSGKCFSAYFAHLNPRKADNPCIVLYQGNGNPVDHKLTANELSANGLALLTTNGYSWYNPTVAPFGSFRYNADLPGNYLYPMLFNHYGDWLTPPQYAYGVAYYEIYENGDQKLHLVDLSDSRITEEGKLFTDKQPISAYVTVSGGSAATSDTNVFNAQGTITDTGYAIFRMRGSAYLDDKIVKDGIIDKLTPYVLPGTADENGQSDYIYDFYQIQSVDENGIVNLGATTVSTNTAAADTRFADAIAENGASISTYYVRTEKQLKNVKHIPSETVSMTHAISVSSYAAGDTIKNFSGTFLNDDKLALTIGTLNAPMFENITGSVTLGNVTISTLESSFITASSGTINLGNITVEPATTAEAAIPETAAESPSSDATTGTEGSTAAAALFGDVSGGSFSTGDITVNTSVSQVFGTVGGAVETKAITVTGDAAQVFGDVNGDVTVTGAITVNGTTPKVFGEIGAAVNAQAITASIGSGQIFGTVKDSGSVTAKVISANGVASGKVFGDVNGEVITDAITVTGDAAQVFGNVKAAVTANGAITVNGSASQVFGTVDAAVETKAISASIGAGQVFGAVGKTGSVTTRAINASVSTGRVFDAVSGAVTTGAITVTGTEGQTASRIFGDVGAVLSTGSIKVTGSIGQIYGNVSAELAYTGEAANAIEVTGTVTTQVAGTVSVGTMIPSPIKLGGMDANAKLLGAVSDNAAVTIGNVDLDGKNVGTLFGPITGTLEGAILKVGAINGTLFSELNDGTISGFAITAASMNDRLVASMKGNSGSLVSGVTLTVTDLASGFGAEGLLVKTLGSKQTVQDTSITVTNSAAITLGTDPFGGLVSTNNGTITNCSVNADFVLSGSGTMGGLAGSNNGSISFTDKTVDVDITYTPGTDTRVTIGGLVGYNSGIITGAESTVAAMGSIVLDGESASHVVGGVIGNMADGEVTDVLSSVAVDEDWKGAANVSGGDTFGGKLTNQGPVGMFVGYAEKGTIADSSSRDKTNKTFQFVGEAKVDSNKVGTGLLVTDTEYPDGFTSDSSLEGNQYITADEQPVTVITITTDTDKCKYVSLTLDNCRFYISDDQTATLMRQDYGVDTFYFEKESEANYNNYKKANSALAGSFKSSNTTFNNARNSTTAYFVKTSDGYHQITVDRTSNPSYWGTIYTYTVSWGNPEKSYSFTDSWFTTYGSSRINDVLDSRQHDVSGVYTLTKPSLSADSYLLISGDQAYKGENSATVLDEFNNRNQALVDLIWTKAELSKANLWASADYTGNMLTSDGNPLALYDVNGVSCQIFAVEKGSGYKVITYAPHTENHMRQYVTAVPLEQTSTASIAEESPETESPAPTGETGGETQESNP